MLNTLYQIFCTSGTLKGSLLWRVWWKFWPPLLYVVNDACCLLQCILNGKTSIAIMRRFPPLNVIKISHIGRNATNRQLLAVLIPGFALVIQLRLEMSGVWNIRSHGDTNKAHKKINKNLKNLKNFKTSAVNFCHFGGNYRKCSF